MTAATFQRQVAWTQQQAEEAAAIMQDETADPRRRERARLRFEAAKAQLFAVDEAKAGRAPMAILNSFRLPLLDELPE